LYESVHWYIVVFDGNKAQYMTRYKSSSLCSYLQPTVTLSFFSPNILLSTLFSSTLSLCFSLNVRDQISHPNKTTGRNEGRQEYKIFWRMVARVTRIQSGLNFIMSQILIYQCRFQTFKLCHFFRLFIRNLYVMIWSHSLSYFERLYFNTYITISCSDIDKHIIFHYVLARFVHEHTGKPTIPLHWQKKNN
jgi:hypothetical protein